MTKKMIFKSCVLLLSVVLMTVSTNALDIGFGYEQSQNNSSKLRALYNYVPMRINSENKKVPAYNIKGNNFFKLRDLAVLFMDSKKEFHIDYDGSRNQINLSPGIKYNKLGTELKTQKSGYKNAMRTNDKLAFMNKQIQVEAYKIEGSNYYKLRDLAKTIDFYVDWDEKNRTIILDLDTPNSVDLGSGIPLVIDEKNLDENFYKVSITEIDINKKIDPIFANKALKELIKTDSGKTKMRYTFYHEEASQDVKLETPSVSYIDGVFKLKLVRSGKIEVGEAKKAYSIVLTVDENAFAFANDAALVFIEKIRKDDTL